MATNEKAWELLNEDKENRQPTPPVKTPVQWYPLGDIRNPVAAIVTGVEGPGRVKLVVFPLNSFPQHKAGVYHTSARIHQEKGNPTTSRCGSWDYGSDEKAPKSHYAVHDAELAKREANLLQAEEQAQKNSELFARKAAEKASGFKKPLPEILAAPK